MKKAAKAGSSLHLSIATMFGRNQLVKAMREFGADKIIRDKRGLTSRDMALQQGNEEALE